MFDENMLLLAGRYFFLFHCSYSFFKMLLAERWCIFAFVWKTFFITKNSKRRYFITNFEVTLSNLVYFTLSPFAFVSGWW